MKAVAAIVVCTLGLGFASTADARPFNKVEQSAYAVALHWWGIDAGPAGCSSVELIVGTVESDSMAGQATQPPAGQPPIPCKLILNGRIRWDRDFEYLCSVLTHEVGHLHGVGHSEDPNDVMYGGEATPGIYVSTPACYRATVKFEKQQRKNRINKRS